MDQFKRGIGSRKTDTIEDIKESRFGDKVGSGPKKMIKPRAFVKGGVLQLGNQENTRSDSGRLYLPSNPKLEAAMK